MRTKKWVVQLTAAKHQKLRAMLTKGTYNRRAKPVRMLVHVADAVFPAARKIHLLCNRLNIQTLGEVLIEPDGPTLRTPGLRSFQSPDVGSLVSGPATGRGPWAGGFSAPDSQACQRMASGE